MIIDASFRRGIVVLAFGMLAAFGSRADEPDFSGQPPSDRLVARMVDQATVSAATVEKALGTALELIGIRYRRGGTSPATGFDCSGFVGHVFKEALGLYLPRDTRQISRTGAVVAKSELLPGDLVFFNTMRRAFSHVGIYLGDNKFVHAPRTGGAVRVEDINDSYWRRRFNGARRIAAE
jgi:cell wall-associated NlpC family hydrolase